MKEKPSFNSYLATALLSIAGSIQYGKLKKASRNPRKASEQTLRRILRNGKDTEYGRLHDFDYILAAKDDVELYRRYAEKVKVSDYEDFRPFIERHKNGAAALDHQVLTFHGAEEIEDLKNGFLLLIILCGLFGHAEITPWCGNQVIGIRVIAGVKRHHTDFMEILGGVGVFPLIVALCRLTFDGHKGCVVAV